MHLFDFIIRIQDRVLPIPNFSMHEGDQRFLLSYFLLLEEILQNYINLGLRGRILIAYWDRLIIQVLQVFLI